MALEVHDRVKETTTTTGSSDAYALGGAVTGFETFGSHLGNTDTTYYVCTDGTNFEIGIGTYNNSANTLTRTTILASSNAGNDNAHSWAAGTKEIFITYPSSKAVFKDASNNINGTFVGDITGNVTGNASGTATTLATARAINGTNFDGSGDITVTAAAGTLTGNTLNSGVTASSLTSVGTLASLTTSGDITVGDDLTVNGGLIDLKTNSGSVAQLKFYCESGNAHAQTLQAQPHSASASDVLTLPTGGNSTLVSRISTDTLTNKSIDSDNNTITNIVNADIKSSAAIANSKLANSSITVADGSSSTAVALGGTITFAGTSNEVEVGESSGTITVGLPDNVTIAGNLTVNGTTTTIDTTNTLVKDSLLGLNNGASSNSNDSGIIIERGSTGNDALLIWDESADKWALGTTTSNASSTGNLNMTTGTLVANIEGNVTGNVTGNTSGTAATVTGAAQSNITSLGTLTGLTVDGTSTLTGGDSGDILLVFNTDRTWQFQQNGDDGSTSLGLKANTDSKSFVIQNSNGDIDFNFFTSHSGTPSFTLGKDAVLTFEGSSDDANETTLTVTDPTADRTITLPNATGTVITTGNTSDVTTVGTLTTLTVDNVIINGSTIGHTGDTDLMTVASGVLTVAGEVDATSLDISGDADIDGTLEADAITVNGTALNTVIADEATALAIALG